jgi:hypothetical protein
MEALFFVPGQIRCGMLVTMTMMRMRRRMKRNQLLARRAVAAFERRGARGRVPRKNGAPSTRLAWEALVSRMAEHTITVVPSSANRSSRYCLRPRAHTHL